MREIDDDAYRATPEKDRHQSSHIVCPSVCALCAVCGLVGEYSALTWGAA